MSADPTVPSAADLDDEPYDSAEDEDFQLDAVQDESDLSSDDEAEPAKKKRKTDKKAEIPAEELDSGDEVTIQRARERRSKKRKGKKSKAHEDEDDIDFGDEDEGGTGGFVRTRAMKQHM